jgi:hypothetical protein
MFTGNCMMIRMRSLSLRGLLWLMSAHDRTTMTTAGCRLGIMCLNGCSLITASHTHQSITYKSIQTEYRNLGRYNGALSRNVKPYSADDADGVLSVALILSPDLLNAAKSLFCILLTCCRHVVSSLLTGTAFGAPCGPSRNAALAERHTLEVLSASCLLIVHCLKETPTRKSCDCQMRKTCGSSSVRSSCSLLLATGVRYYLAMRRR